VKHNHRTSLPLLGLVITLQGLTACRSFYHVDVAVDPQHAWATDERKILVDILVVDAELLKRLQDTTNGAWFHMPEQVSETYAAKHAFDRWTISAGQAELHGEHRIRIPSSDGERRTTKFPYGSKSDERWVVVFYDYPGSDGMRSSADQKPLTAPLQEHKDWVLVIGRNAPPELEPGTRS
jgi:hypothetical protein